jgi:hypothetical protein
VTNKSRSAVTGQSLMGKRDLGVNMNRTVCAVVALATAFGLPPAGPVGAQEGGGQTLSLTLSERLEATRNLALTPDGDETTLQSLSTAAFAYGTATQTSEFSFGTSLNLRAVGGSASDETDIAFADPSVRLSYGQRGPASQFGLSASFTRAEVAFLRPLTDFIDGDQILLPDDFADLSGTGSRSTLALNTSLSLRDDARFGLSFTGGVTDLSYQDVSDPTLADSTRLQAGVQARFDLTEVTSATLGLSYTGLETDGADPTDTFGLRGGLTFDRPDGNFGLSLNASENSGATLIGFRVSREFSLPDSTLGASFGVSRTDDTGAVVTGALTYSLERPTGTLTARLDRDISIEDGDTSTVQTALGLSASQALARDLTGTLRAGLARSEEDGVRTDLADLGASLGYSLTPDWSLSAGASYILRDDESASGSAAAQSLSLTLTRSFGARN